MSFYEMTRHIFSGGRPPAGDRRLFNAVSAVLGISRVPERLQKIARLMRCLQRIVYERWKRGDSLCSIEEDLEKALHEVARDDEDAQRVAYAMWDRDLASQQERFLHDVGYRLGCQPLHFDLTGDTPKVMCLPTLSQHLFFAAKALPQQQYESMVKDIKEEIPYLTMEDGGPIATDMFAKAMWQDMHPKRQSG
jgi:hypothetical protein